MRIKNRLWRFLPLIIIILALTAFLLLGGADYISLDTLRQNQNQLKQFVTNHYFLAITGFIILYALLVAISFPGASLLSVFAGFLFGVINGVFSVVIGATIGAVIIFLVTRSAFGSGLASKAVPFLQKFEKGLGQSELSYLFILRLIPVFPFFIVNIAPALLNVKTSNYVLSTFFGIIPGALVYVGVGAGIGDVLSAGEKVDLSGIMFRPTILLPVLGLIILFSIPIIYKSVKQDTK